MFAQKRRNKSPLLTLIFVLSLYITIDAQITLLSPDTLYMGQIPISSKAIRQLYISNIDSKDLIINSLSLSNTEGFKILNDPGAQTIKFLESLEIDIEFSPSQNGPLESELLINSNAKSGPSSLLIQGIGLETTRGITFERIFGLEEGSGISCVTQTIDGGYILGGSANLPNSDYSDFYIVKTDYLGEVQWEKIYGRDYTDGIVKILQTSDNGYIVLGNTETSASGRTDVYLSKLDSAGNVNWEKNYGGQYDDNSSSIVKISGGYLIVGSTTSYGDGSSDIYLIKVDDSGNELWHKNYGGSGGDTGSDIIKTNDDNYAIIGTTSSYGAAIFDIYLMKVDGDGNKLWDKLYGGSDWDNGNAIAELQDGSLVLAGFAVGFGAGARDMFLVKTDAEGNEQWHKAFGGIYQDAASSVIATTDGIIMGGHIAENIDYNNLYVIKTDLNGNKIWESSFGDRNNENASDLIQNSDGHVVVVGSTSSFSKNSSTYFINLNPQGQITDVYDSQEQSLQLNFKLFANYPNPFNGQTQITYQLPGRSSVELSVFNVIGQRVAILFEGIKTEGLHRIKFNSKGLSSGVYFYKLSTKYGVIIKKMLLLK